MFADDTAIFLNGKKSKDIEQQLNSDLRGVKCECILIGTPQKLCTEQPIQLRLGQNNIKMVNSSKYLGLMVDSHISWFEHVDALSKNVSRIGLMSRIRNYLDSSTSKLIYNAIVVPLFDYCDIVWDCCNASSKVKLQNLQNRARKVILKSESPQSKWLTLDESRHFHKAAFMYNCLHYEDNGFELHCTWRSEVHHHNTRRKNDIAIPKPNTEQLK